MSKLREHFDLPSIFVIVATIILFVMALYIKGLTHEMLLEGAVFLISVKLILASYKNSVTIKRLESKLDDLLSRARP